MGVHVESRRSFVCAAGERETDTPTKQSSTKRCQTVIFVVKYTKTLGNCFLGVDAHGKEAQTQI